MDAVELYCENRPRCSFEVSTHTPGMGWTFPNRCPQCNGDLQRAADYNGPEP